MQDTLTVRERMVDFISAARLSQESYTVRDLQEMVELEFLTETGGIVSWIKRKLTNIDDSALADIQESIDGITTEQDRQRVLREIEMLLADAEEIAGRGAVRNVATGVGAATGSIAALGVVKLASVVGDVIALPFTLASKTASAVKKAATGKTWASIFSSGAKAPPPPKSLMDKVSGSITFGNAVKGAIVGYAVYRIAQGLARIYVNNDGSMVEYIAALRAVRKDIEDKKLGDES